MALRKDQEDNASSEAKQGLDGAWLANGADADPEETREWLDSLEYVLEHVGIERASFLLERLSSRLTETGARLPYTITTPYRNTIPANHEAFMPGDLFMERRIRSLIRWNALAMVVRANRKSGELGGHISTFASAATLYDVGFNYFFRGPTDDQAGDLIYFQGHSSPASTRVPTWRDASTKRSWTLSGRKSTATACHPIPTPG